MFTVQNIAVIKYKKSQMIFETDPADTAGIAKKEILHKIKIMTKASRKLQQEIGLLNKIEELEKSFNFFFSKE